MKELIRLRERTAVSHAEELLEKIQGEVVELRRAGGELEKLSHTEDHFQFLQVLGFRKVCPEVKLNLQCYDQPSLTSRSSECCELGSNS